MKNIKADLVRRIAAHIQIIEIEPTEPPEPEDQSRYGEKLRRELEHSYDRLNVPESKRERRGGELRDSSVELAEPLDSAIDAEIVVTREYSDHGEEDDDDGGRDGSEDQDD